MHTVIHRLLRPGGLEVARKFRKARTFWEAFHKLHRASDVHSLAVALTGAQHGYETLMAFDRSFAKETMAFTCIGALYDYRRGWLRGRLAYAERIIRAFALSSTAMEVKAAARSAAQLYGLEAA